jgi:hypothetical protein
LGSGSPLFSGHWIDWSGFVFNIGAAAILLFLNPTRRTFRIAILMTSATALAGLAILVHYAAVVDLATVLRIMTDRFVDRSLGGQMHSTVYNVVALVQG